MVCSMPSYLHTYRCVPAVAFLVVVVQELTSGNSLVVQWLGLWTLIVKGPVERSELGLGATDQSSYPVLEGM